MRLEDVLVEEDRRSGRVEARALIGRRIGDVTLGDLIILAQSRIAVPNTFAPEEVEHGVEQDYL